MALDYNVLRKVKGNPSEEVVPGRRLKLNPGQNYPYDMPKELIPVIAEKFPLESLISFGSGEVDQIMAERGQEFMCYLIGQADSDAFRDRTAEMIEVVAKQTGIRFPHSFERYVELAILTLRPRDAWTVSEATTKRLQVRSYNCSLSKAFAEKGIANCQAFCLAACQTAANKMDVNVEMAKSKDLATDGMCELTFTVKLEG